MGNNKKKKENDFKGGYLAISAVVGVVLGFLFDNVGMGVGLGLLIGTVLALLF